MKKLFLSLLILLGFLNSRAGGYDNYDTVPKVPIWNITAFVGTNLHGGKLVMDLTSTTTRSITYDVFTAALIADSLFASKPFVIKIKDSLISIFASQYVSKTKTITINNTQLDFTQSLSFSVGTVLQVNPGYGMNFVPVTGTGSVSVDSLTVTSWQRLYKVRDSLYTLFVQVGGSYANPSWISSLAWSKITGTPTTLSAYGITDAIAMGIGVLYTDTATMLLPYQKIGGTVNLVYDSAVLFGLGTGPSPLTLITQSKIVPGYYTAPVVHITNKGIIDSIVDGSGSVGSHLFLPLQSSLTATPVGGFYVFDSLGLVWMGPDGYRKIIDGTANTANHKYTLPNSDITFAGININNNFTAVQTILNATSNQFVVGYDASNKFTISVASNGNTTFTSTGTLQTNNISTGNINMSGGSVFTLASGTGRFALPTTMTAAGTTGAQTINKMTGSINAAAGNSSVVVTNSTVQSASSIVQLQVYGNDATAKSATVSSVSTGSFTIQLNANATAETKISFVVYNGYRWILLIIIISIFITGIKLNINEKKVFNRKSCFME